MDSVITSKFRIYLVADFIPLDFVFSAVRELNVTFTVEYALRHLTGKSRS